MDLSPPKAATHSTLSAAQLDKVLTVVEEAFDLSACRELTVEAGRPDSVTPDKFKVLKAHNVGRISINPQTMNQKTLDLIGYMQNGEGKAGLEKLYDEQLSGTNGLEIYIEDSNGQKKQSLANPISFPEPIPAKGKLSLWEYDKIQEPVSDGDHNVCICRICVDEKVQVMSMGKYFVCKYCGGRWYK